MKHLNDILKESILDDDLVYTSEEKLKIHNMMASEKGVMEVIKLIRNKCKLCEKDDGVETTSMGRSCENSIIKRYDRKKKYFSVRTPFFKDSVQISIYCNSDPKSRRQCARNIIVDKRMNQGNPVKIKRIPSLYEIWSINGGLDTYEVCPELEWLYDYMNS